MAVLRFAAGSGPVLLALAIVTGFGPMASTAAEPPRGPTLARAIQVRRQHANQLLAIRNVVGTAAGKDRDGKSVVKVYLRAIGAAVPKELDGVPVQAVATGEFFALAEPRSRQSPVHRRIPLPPKPPQFFRHPPFFWPPPLHEPHHPPKDRDASPTVLITAPSEGEVLSDEVQVTAEALDDNGVVRVDFYVDDAFLGSDTDGSDGYSAAWDTTQDEDGRHALSAVVTDTSDQTGSDNIEVVVDNVPGPFSPDGRPVSIGVSTGNENECSAGTIACRVRDAQGNVYALSNNHVYARLNNAEIGELILQPGLYDTDCAAYYTDQTIGVLSGFVPIEYGLRGVNTIDAAIAISSESDLGKATPGEGYGTPKSTPVAASVGQLVQKYGRSTLLTTGTISGIDAEVVVTYGTRRATFSGQIIVGGTAFIDAGDSGSLLVTHCPATPDDDLKPVGLLFAGNSDGSTAIANPIQPVLDAFGVTIDGQ